MLNVCRRAAIFSAIILQPRLIAVWAIFLLGGCGWFATSQPEQPITEQTVTLGEATLPPPTQPTPTPISPTSSQSSPTARATTTPTATPTLTPTPRPIAVSLLPLPSLGVSLTTSYSETTSSAITPTLAALLAPTPDGVHRTAQVPILMYHYLSEPPADADIYRRDLSVSPALFTAQVDAMQAAGYTTVSLYDLLGYLTQGTPLPTKSVVLTFDDGYRDNYVNALPILKAHGMKATFFIVSDFIDEKRPEYLSWDMVRELYAAGMSIEAHGRNHVSLRGKDKDYLIWQALGNAETIQAELGVRPRFICYPSGEYDQQTIDIFHSANYWAGLTTVQGATHDSQDMFELRRVRVRGTTTPEELIRILGLDW